MSQRRSALTALTAVSAWTLCSGVAFAATAPLPNPASQLQVIRGTEAGHQTLSTTRAIDPLIQPDTTTEPSIAVDPLDPKHVVTGYQMGRDDAGGDISNGFATSFDQGATWAVGTVPGLTSFDPVSPTSPYKRGSDAVLAFGPPDATTHKSLVYYSSLVFDPTGANTRSAIVNSTSHDGGLTWDLPTIVQDDQGGGLNDKNWVVVDNSSAPGHHLGRVYVVWDRVAGVIAKYSDDQGKTWNGPPSPAYTPNVFAGQGIGALPVVLPSGALAVVFSTITAPPPVAPKPGDELGEVTAGMSRIELAVAPLAGQTPSGAPLAFGPATNIALVKSAAVRHQRAGGLISADVDPLTGRVYIAVEDAETYRTDGNNDAVVYVTPDALASTPTWTETRVDAGPPADQVDHYDPAVAVGPGSTVRVLWRQRQELASNTATFDPYISTWVAQSTDGGATFLPALQVDRGVNDARFGAFSRNGTFQGDYDQIVTATDGTSYVVHCESESFGDPAPATPTADTVHHQRTRVTVLTAATPDPLVPELPNGPLALLVAGAAGAGFLAHRSRRSTREVDEHDQPGAGGRRHARGRLTTDRTS